MRTLCVAGLTVGSLLWMAATLQAQTDAPAPAAATQPVRNIGVADLGRLLKGYKKYAEGSAALKAKNKVAKDEYGKKQEKMKGLQAKYKDLKAIYTPGSAQLTAHERKMADLQIDIKQYVDKKRRELSVFGGQLLRASFKDIQRELTRYARQNGYSLILQTPTAKIEGDDLQSVQVQVFGRRVLYHDEGLDITDAVLKQLNAAYEAAKSGG